MLAARLRARGPLVPGIALLLTAAVCALLGGTAYTTPRPDGVRPGEVRAPEVSRVIAPAAPRELRQPTGIAVSGDRIYVADPERGAVAVMSRDGSPLDPLGAGTLDTPVYVAVSPVDGRVYVADRGAGRLAVFAADGTRRADVTAAPSPDGTGTPGWRPLALSFGGDGRLYVADVAGVHRIRVLSPLMRQLGSMGASITPGRTGAALSFPNGIAATRSGLWVADSNNGRVVRLDASGRPDRVVRFDGLPRGIAPLPGGHLVVVDSAAHALRVITRDGRFVTAVGGYGSGPGRFAFPTGVATDPEGRVYVADTGNARVQVVRIPGITTPEIGGLAAAWPWLAVAAGLGAAGAVVTGWGYARTSRNDAHKPAGSGYNPSDG